MRGLAALGESSCASYMPGLPNTRHPPTQLNPAQPTPAPTSHSLSLSLYAATYEVIYMTGWAPHPKQQQPAKRGSATVSFEDLVSDMGDKPQSGSSSSSSGDSQLPKP